jgi:hypothetical protein
MTRKLLTLAALAVTLGAQGIKECTLSAFPYCVPAPTIAVASPSNAQDIQLGGLKLSCDKSTCASQVITLDSPVRMPDIKSYDGNGALEAFYAPPAHHSIFKSRKFWIGVGVMAGSGVLAGYLATRGPARSFGPAASIQQPVAPQITVNGPTFIGIGGPGLSVVIGKKK